LLTHLANTVQPLIRYDLGDQITLAAQPCSCGSPLPVIAVRGRQDESLVMKGGHGRMVTILPLALTTILEDQAGVFDFQVRQKNDHTLLLRLGLRGAEAVAAMERCRGALKAFAASLGLGPIHVVELNQPLMRGRTGKVCRVIAAGGRNAPDQPPM
jgi:phenylacetate-coenzyme A ligase PaaK-like adenylate-forming protein